jgi:hypothetical protein
VPRPDLQEVEGRLARLLARATGLLPEEQLSDMLSIVQAGEPGVALENFCTQLCEYDVSVPPELAAELEVVAAAMGLRISPPFRVAP